MSKPTMAKSYSEAEKTPYLRLDANLLEHCTQRFGNPLHDEMTVDNCNVSWGSLDQKDIRTSAFVRRKKLLMLCYTFSEIKVAKESLLELLLNRKPLEDRTH